MTDPAGGMTRYAYDSQHRLTTITDARGIVFLTNTYDANSRVCQQQQADGGVFTMYYVTVDTATTPQSTLLLQQAAAGGPISQAPCAAAASSSPVAATVLVDPLGHPRTHRFNAFGVLIQTTDALGQTTTYEREPATNLLLAITDPLGRRTAYTYDAAGNVLSVTRLAGTAEAVTTTFTYEPVFDQVASVRDPLQRTTTLGYDSAGNLITVTDPLGQGTTLTYDASGQPLSITDALGHTVQLTYDAGGLATLSDPAGAVARFVTDGGGRLLERTTPLGPRTGYAYDPLNRLTAVTDPLGGVTQLSYDPNGNLVQLVDALTHATAYTYDLMDRVATRTDPLGHGERYGYDLGGNRTSVTDRKGQVTSTTYDALNRPTQVSYADGSSTSYTWDAGSRLTQVVDSLAGTITRAYDGLDRLTQETTAQGTVSYTYDAAGRRTSLTATGQAPVTYAYDDADRLTQIAQGTAIVTVAYDSAGRRTRLTLPNGVTTSYAYDAASRLTGLTYTLGSATLGTLTYTYDANGQRIATGGTWAATGLPQPMTAATYDAANRQVTFGALTLTYDLNGNLTSDGTSTYLWNARNQLVAITGASVTASFAYDGLGRRQRKTIDAIATEFLYDGLTPIQEREGPNLVANLLTGLGVDEYVTRTDGTGPRHFLVDALGSTVALTDDTGAVTTAFTYEPFGATTLTGAATNNAFDYTGREDDGTGLKYYRARYYSPTLHRFLSEDVISELGLSRYAYVRNTPLNAIDPDGLRTLITTGLSASVGDLNDGLRFLRDELEGREPVQVFGVSQMAAIVAAAEAACAAGETVNLVGHSMGGTTDVAVALALFQRGWVVNNLITIDANLPFGGALPSQIRATNYYRQGGWLHGDPLHGANVTNVVVPNVSHWAITQAVEPEIKGIILGTRKAEPGGCQRL